MNELDPTPEGAASWQKPKLEEMSASTEISQEAEAKITQLNQQVETNFLKAFAKANNIPESRSLGEGFRKHCDLELSYLLGQKDDHLSADSMEDHNYYVNLYNDREASIYNVSSRDTREARDFGPETQVLGVSRILKKVREIITQNSQPQPAEKSDGENNNRINVWSNMPDIEAKGQQDRNWPMDNFGLGRPYPNMNSSLLTTVLGIDIDKPTAVNEDKGQDTLTYSYQSATPGLRFERRITHPGEDQISVSHRIESIDLIAG